jgi:hypothetical protein
MMMCGLLALKMPVRAQGLAWAQAFGSEGDEVAMSVAVDGQNNVLLAGYFEGVMDVDPGPGEQLLISNGQNDMFLKKLDADGALIWALHVGGSGADYATGVSTDASGNVYVTGAFNEVVDFDPGTGTADLSSAGEHDIFLAKYAPTGDFLGAWRVGGSGYDEPKDVAVGAMGNVYLLSYFNGTIDADPGTGVLTITSQGQLDMLVQRFNSEGELAWAQATGANGADLGLAMALDAEENIWITGSFEGTVDMDPSAGSFPLSSAGAWDIFVTKRSADGELLWAGRMGGVENFDTGYDIAVDADGNAIVAGSFMGSGDFDPGTGVFMLTASSLGSDEIFVQKLSPSGEFMWAGALGGEGADLGYGVGVTADGRVLVTGFFSGTADFDPDPLGVFELTTTTQDNFFDSYLCTLSPEGTFLGAVQFAGANSVATQRLAVGADDAIYVAGHFENVVDMDPGTTEVSATSNGFRDAFVLRFADLGLGLPETELLEPPMIFPNPATDQVSIDVDASLVGLTYAVYDAQGIRVAQGRLESTRTRLSLDGLAAGSYRVQVQHPAVPSGSFVVLR